MARGNENIMHVWWECVEVCELVLGLVSAVRYLIKCGCRMARGNEKIMCGGSMGRCVG